MAIGAVPPRDERSDKMRHDLQRGTRLTRELRTLLQTPQPRLIVPPTQQSGVERARGVAQADIPPHDEPDNPVSVAADTQTNPQGQLAIGAN